MRVVPWWGGCHCCTTSVNKARTQVLHRLKPCSQCVGYSWLWGSLTMVLAGNKAKHLLSVNHTTKTIHHHHHHHYYHHHHHHYCTTLINYAWTHRFCTGLNTAHSVLHISDGEDLWQWFQLEIRVNTFCQSAILPKFIITFIIIIIPLEMCVVLFGSNSQKVSALKKVFQP